MGRRGDGPLIHEVAALVGSSVVHVRMLVEIGVPERTAYARCRPGGPWRSLLPGVVSLRNGPPTRDDRRRAALVYVGEPAVLTGADALELHGIRNIPRPSGPVHLLVPADRRRGGAGKVLAERTERMPEPTHGRWPLAPVCRAVLDFARRSRDRDVVRAALAEVVQRGMVGPAELDHELAACSSRGSAVPRSVLEEIGAGVRSVAEAHARRLVGGSGLPAPVWNPRLVDSDGRFIAMPDAWFGEVGLAWEIDSHEFHLSPADHERNIARHTAMTAHGIVVFRTLPGRVRREPRVVLDELRDALAAAASRPRPPSVSVASLT